MKVCKRYLLGSSKEATSWPYWVHYVPAYTKNPYDMSEGRGHVSAGGYFSAQEIIKDRWKDHLRFTNCLWLFDLLINSSDLNQISEKTVLSHYKRHYGDLPVFDEIEYIK